MKPKLIIAAANGFIGKSLIQFFSNTYEIVGLVRKPLPSTDNVRYVVWDGKTLGAWSQELEHAKALINLAGRSINCRYTEQNKRDILESRIESTQVLGEAIKQCKVKPERWINCSSITLYEHSFTEPQDEFSTKRSSGFSTDVCMAWEAVFNAYSNIGVRQILLRISVVLGKNEGALKPLVPITKLGLGGRSGSGKQMFSWIHIHDFCRAVQALLENPEAQGAYNMASPEPVTNAVFMQALRAALKQPIGIPQPEWTIKLGAKFIGTEPELVLESLYAIPTRLTQLGFIFQYPKIEDALRQLLA